MAMQVATQEPVTLKSLLGKADYKKRFEEMLGKRSAGFISSILNVVNQNKELQKCDPGMIIGCAAIAASMDLPIDPNLGFSYIVPYSGKPQFQVGYKGFIQLAMRTGQYQTMNVCEVYEGELVKVNRFTGDVTLDGDARTSDEVVGYVAYMRLLNGFEKYLYLSVDEIRAHAQKYSKGFGASWSRWTTDFHSMAMKTCLKRLLSKWGVLSLEMQTAIKADQAAVRTSDDGEVSYEYVDNPHSTMKNVTPEPDLNARLEEVAERVAKRDASLSGM